MRKPEKTIETNTMTVSIRLPPDVVYKVQQVAKEEQLSDARLMRRMIEDWFDFFGMPDPIPEILGRECEQLGYGKTNIRKYIQRVLLKHYQQQSEAPAGKPR
jgi:hypothetical protein